MASSANYAALNWRRTLDQMNSRRKRLVAAELSSTIDCDMAQQCGIDRDGAASASVVAGAEV
jgi:hypothetical protein